MNNDIKHNGNDFEVVQTTPDHMRVMDAMAEALETSKLQIAIE